MQAVGLKAVGRAARAGETRRLVSCREKTRAESKRRERGKKTAINKCCERLASPAPPPPCPRNAETRRSTPCPRGSTAQRRPSGRTSPPVPLCSQPAEFFVQHRSVSDAARREEKSTSRLTTHLAHVVEVDLVPRHLDLRLLLGRDHVARVRRLRRVKSDRKAILDRNKPLRDSGRTRDIRE